MLTLLEHRNRVKANIRDSPARTAWLGWKAEARQCHCLDAVYCNRDET